MDAIREIFAEAIRRKGLNQEEVKEMSERMLKEVRKEKKIRYGVSDR